MLSAIHDISMNTVRGHMSVQQQPRTSPSSWLGKQRKAVSLAIPCDILCAHELAKL